MVYDKVIMNYLSINNNCAIFIYTKPFYQTTHTIYVHIGRSSIRKKKDCDDVFSFSQLVFRT